MSTGTAPALTSVTGEPPAPLIEPTARRRFRPHRPSAWHLVLIPITFILLAPFFLMVVTSLETPAETRTFPPVLIPHHPQWANYPHALDAAPFVRFMINSAVVAIVVVAANLLLCSVAGYAFARLRFLGRGVLFAVLMATLMVPFQVTMIPEFLIVKWLGTNVWNQLGIDHLGALIVPNMATAFGIFFLRQFFLTLPVELEEAARIDGTSRLGVLFKIVLPLSLPALATLGIIQFLWSWNDFLWPLIIINTASHAPLQVGLSMLQGSHSTEWNLLMAGTLMSQIPILAAFVFAQRWFVQSLAYAGIKS